MLKILLDEEYILVLDTDSLIIDFYREICSFCTGHDADSCRSMVESDRFHDDFQDENPFSVNIKYKDDGEGGETPCSVWLNKRYGCDEDGNFGLLDENNFQSYGFPAPMSVGIFFLTEPTQTQINLIRSRAEAFLAERKPSPKLESLRLITHTKYGEERVLS